MKMAKRKPNKYKIDGDTLILYNNKDNREMYFDVEDFDLITQYTWYIHRGYAETALYNPKKQLSAQILLKNFPKDYMVDHMNGNPLDNRKSNLRIATSQVNQHNQRKAKGYFKKDNGWQAQITVNKKKIYIGYYKTEAEARAAYLKAKQIYHPSAPTHLWQQL